MMQSKRITAVPVNEDFQNHFLRSLTNEPLMAKIIRGNNFNHPVYKGDVRPEIIRGMYQYLSSVGNSEGYREITERDLTDFSVRQNLARTDDVEENSMRDASPFAILPDGVYSPGQDSMPLWFLNLSSPYAKTMPIFFPEQIGDWDDPRRDQTRPISETEWIGHTLRSVHKELVEFPLFPFTAAYRMDMKSIQSAYNSCIGYRQAPDGQFEKSDVDGQRFTGTVPGSSEYLAKHKADIAAKCETKLEHPTLFVTLTNTDQWDVVLSTALSQDGWNTWHQNDERKRLRLLEGQVHPDEEECEYFVHSSPSRLVEDDCPYHEDCKRSSIHNLLGNEAKQKLLSRNTYNIQRIFCQRTSSLIRNVIMSTSNGIGGIAFHFLKEFGSGGGLAHAHGLVWQRDSQAKQAILKMQRGELVDGMEVDDVCHLVNTTVTASLIAENLKADFPDLNDDRSRDIVRLAKRVQSHSCEQKCEMQNDDDGCLYHFPRLPAESTIICSPIGNTMDKKEAWYLQKQCRKMKINVRAVLERLNRNGELQDTTLTQVLLQALGPVDDHGPDGAGWYEFKNGGLFPQCLRVERWIQQLQSEGHPYPIMHALYNTALCTATWHVEGELVYQIVLKRAVREAYTVDYNPYLLEAMRSNMEVRYVTHTPHLLINYVTKAEDKPNIERVIEDIKKAGGTVTGARIASQTQDYRKVSLPEAFFRIDTRLTLSNTNVQVNFVNTKFPHLRGSMYKQSPEGQIHLPGRDGSFVLLDGTLAKYAKRYFHSTLANLELKIIF